MTLSQRTLDTVIADVLVRSVVVDEPSAVGVAALQRARRPDVVVLGDI